MPAHPYTVHISSIKAYGNRSYEGTTKKVNYFFRQTQQRLPLKIAAMYIADSTAASCWFCTIYLLLPQCQNNFTTHLNFVQPRGRKDRHIKIF
jgi:hypothetical protein